MPEEPGVVSFPKGTVEGLLNTGGMKIVSSEQEKIKEARAREIMEEEFLGVEEITKGLNIEIDTENLPKIQFTEEELRRAKELGFRLVLRVSQTKDGQPLTMQFLNDHIQPDFTSGNNGKILYRVDWYKDDPFFTNDVPETQWALVSNEVIPGSTEKNYLEQTQVIADYLRDELYGTTSGIALPKKYADAIAELEGQKAEIQKLLAKINDIYAQKEAGRRLAELMLNKLTRATPVDTLFDQLSYFGHTAGKRLLENTYTWTSVRSADGLIVMLGRFDSNGMPVNSPWPNSTHSRLGVCISL